MPTPASGASGSFISRREQRRIAAAPSPAVAGFRPAGVALAVAAAFMGAGDALAQPTGAQVLQGQALLKQQGNSLVVTTQNAAGTNRSVINWQSFSVPSGSSTRFDQPTVQSLSINRVVGNDPSAIFGTLSSNGRLVLVNPSGIAVGAGAVVDTAGFTASTLRMTDADALAGRLLFGDGSLGGGGMRVDGSIVARSGDVVLIAPNVQVGQQALVQAPNGSTLLAAGQKVELTGRGLEGIVMQVQAPDNSAVNLGTLQGDAVGIFAGTLKHSGLIQANAVTTDGGRVVLRATGDNLVDGAITAKAGGNGGSVDLLGDRVALYGNGSIDASGATGGGSVRIGGDYQGSNASVPNASSTFVGANATINADATQAGNGGRVIVWSNDGTRFYGNISARGGANGGDGGFAEVSGKQYLEFAGAADMRAPGGQTGTLLLDPNNINISSGTTSIGLPGGIPVVFGGGVGTSTLNNGLLSAQLETSDVIVKTSLGSGGSGNITVSAPVTWSNAHALALDADGTIAIGGSIGAPSGTLMLLGSLGISQTAPIKVASLFLETGSGSAILTDTGNRVGTLAASVATLNFVNGTSLAIGSVSSPSLGLGGSGILFDNGATVTTSGGDLFVNQNISAFNTNADVRLKSSGSIMLTASIGPASSNVPKTVSLDAGTFITESIFTKISAQTLGVKAGGSVALNSPYNQVSVLSATGGASSDFEFRNSTNLTVGSYAGGFTAAGINWAGPVALAVAGNLTQTPAGIITTPTLGIASSNNGSVSLGSANKVDMLAASGGSGSGTVFVFNNAGPLTVGSIDENFYVDGIDWTGPVNLSTTASNPITLSSNVIAHGGSPLTITAGGTLSLDSSRVAQTEGGPITLVSKNGDIAFGNASVLSNGGDISLQATAGVIGGGQVASYDINGAMNPGNITLSGKGVFVDTVDAAPFFPVLGATPGGNVTVTGGSLGVSIGSIYAFGGNSSSGNGGGGGNVVVAATNGGSVYVNGIFSTGGSAYSLGTGGTGGAVSLSSGTGTITANFIMSAGGYSSMGNGGSGGNVVVNTGGSLGIGTIVAVAGPSTSLGSGGNGGNVTVTATGSGSVSISDIYAYGGVGGVQGGTGGNGGVVSITTGSGSTWVGFINTSGASSQVAAAGSGNTVFVSSSGSLGIGSIYSSGAPSYSLGAGGNAGNVTVIANTFTTVPSIGANGGSGGTSDLSAGPAGGNGGSGGTVLIKQTAGTFVTTPSIYASGGTGGDGFTSMGPGSGGNGGHVTIQSTGGALTLTGGNYWGYIHADAGGSGYDYYNSVAPVGGSLGSITALATTVNVNGQIDFSGNWFNTTAMNMTSAYVSGGGYFSNEPTGKLTIGGNSTLAAYGGVLNQLGGTITSSPGGAVLSVTDNYGTLTIPAGTSLGIATNLITSAAFCAGATTSGCGFFALFNHPTGVIQGSGMLQLYGNDLDNYGHIKPGGAGTVGSLSVGGGVRFEAGSFLDIDIASASSYDKLSVSGSTVFVNNNALKQVGTAAATDATVQITYLDGATFATGDTFSILSSSGGVFGTPVIAGVSELTIAPPPPSAPPSVTLISSADVAPIPPAPPPTVAPTPAPTIAPTPAPTVAPTPAPTVAPTPPPTSPPPTSPPPTSPPPPTAPPPSSQSPLADRIVELLGGDHETAQKVVAQLDTSPLTTFTQLVIKEEKKQQDDTKTPAADNVVANVCSK